MISRRDVLLKGVGLIASPLIPRGSVFSFLLNESPVTAIATPLNEAFKKSLAGIITSYMNIIATDNHLTTHRPLPIPFAIDRTTQRIEKLMSILISHDWERHFDLDAIADAYKMYNPAAKPNEGDFQIFKDRNSLVTAVRGEVSGLLDYLKERSMLSDEITLTKEKTVIEFDSIFKNVGIDLDHVSHLSPKDVHFLIESKAQFEWGFRPGLFDLDSVHEQMLETLSRHPLTLFARSKYQWQHWRDKVIDVRETLLEMFYRADIPVQTFRPDQLKAFMGFSEQIGDAATTADGIQHNAERFAFSEIENSLAEASNIVSNIKVQADQREELYLKRRIERLGYSFIHPAWLGEVWHVAANDVRFEKELPSYGLIIDTDQPSPALVNT